MSGNYSAGYYDYLWSEVLAVDMFATLFKPNVMSKEAGKRYREEILTPGSSKDELLRNFPGREPVNTAFLKSKNIES